MSSYLHNALDCGSLVGKPQMTFRSASAINLTSIGTTLLAQQARWLSSLVSQGYPVVSYIILDVTSVCHLSEQLVAVANPKSALSAQQSMSWGQCVGSQVEKCP